MKAITGISWMFALCGVLVILSASYHKLKEIRDCQAINNFEYSSCEGKLR